MRIVGILLIIVGAAGIGCFEAYGVLNRFQNGSALKKALLCLRGEVEFARTPLPEAFEHVGRKVHGKIGTFFQNMAQGLEQPTQISFVETWEEQMKVQIHAQDMTKEDRTILLELGRTLGYLDARMQINTINLYLEQLGTSLEEQQKQKNGKVRLYNALGVTGGIIIALLIC